MSGSTIDNTYSTIPSLTINDNSIASVALLNLYGSHSLIDNLKLSASIRNALPPYPNLPQPQFNGQYYDVDGRSFRGAVTYRFLG